MKFARYILMSAAVLGVLAGCGKLDKVTAPDPSTARAAVLTTVPASVVVTAENQTTESASFEWTPTDYGFPAAPTYSIMISVGGGEAIELAAAEGSSVEVSYDLLNGKVIAAGGETGVETEVTYTIVSVLTPSFGTPITSAPKTGKVTARSSTSYLWIAGTLDIVAWAPDSPLAPRLTSLVGAPFEGMVDLNSAAGLMFKFCSQPSWAGPNYGGSVNALDPDGGDIADLPGGYYRLVVDNPPSRVTSKLKIDTIGAIGNGVPGDWGSETKMEYDAQTNTWTIPSITLTAGGAFKLRINDDWANALGGTPDALSFTGGDIPVTVSGDHKMILHAGEFPYRIEFVKL